MKELRKRTLNLSQDNYQSTAASYRSDLISSLNYGSISIISDQSFSNLEIQFINLRLQPQNLEGSVSHDELTIESALQKNRHLLIMGPAGSGKTSLLRIVALSAARGLLRNVSNLPVLLSATQISKEGSLGKQIQTVIEKLADSKISFSELQKSLSEGNILLLFDGLDEVLDINTIIAKIREFATEYPLAHIIVTSRNIIDISELNFKAYHIAPLSSLEIRRLIDMWYFDEPHLAQVFWTELENNPSLLSLASNPLLLRRIFELYKQQNRLPRDNSSLQEMYLETFLPSLLSPLPNSSRRFAESLAFFMHFNKQSMITEAEIVERVEQLSHDIEQLNNVAGDLAKLSKIGLLEVQKPNYYRFAQLVFQEYFCAEYLYRLERDTLFDFITERAGDDWWQSVFALISKRMSDASKLVSHLLKSSDTSQWLLAAKLLNEGINVTENLRIKMAENLCKLLSTNNTPVASKASNLLIQFKEPEVDRLCQYQFKQQSNDPLAVTFIIYVLAARGKKESGFYRTLMNTLQNPDVDVRVQTCKALGVLNTEQSAELLIDTLNMEKNPRVTWQALSSLCSADILKKINSSSTAQLLAKILEIKRTSTETEDLHIWAEILERKIINQKSFSESTTQ